MTTDDRQANRRAQLRRNRAVAARRNETRGRRGSTLVETALVLPVLMLMVFGILEYSRFFMTMQVLNNAAHEGARYAMSHTQSVTVGGVTQGNATSDVTAIVTQNMAGQSLATQSVSVYKSDSLGNNNGTWTSATVGDYVAVKISGNFKMVTPTLLFLPSSFPVTATSVMRTEAN